MEKFDKIPEIQEFMEVVTLLDSDKPFTSIVKIANEQLMKFLIQK